MATMHLPSRGLPALALAALLAVSGCASTGPAPGQADDGTPTSWSTAGADLVRSGPVSAPASPPVATAPVIGAVVAPPRPPAPVAQDAATRSSRPAGRSRAASSPAPSAASSSESVSSEPVSAEPAAPVGDPGYEAGLLSGVNAARADAGLSALATSSCASGYAETWANALAEAGELAHQDMGRVMSGCDAIKAAENVARTGGSDASMVDLWLDSAGHRANVLDPALTHVGTAAVDVNGVWTGVQVFLTL